MANNSGSPAPAEYPTPLVVESIGPEPQDRPQVVARFIDEDCGVEGESLAERVAIFLSTEHDCPFRVRDERSGHILGVWVDGPDEVRHG